MEDSSLTRIKSCNVTWVEQSSLRISNLTHTFTPPSARSFPFNRLASDVYDNGSTSLYHQLDDSTLAEERWDADENEFVYSTNISVDTS